MPARPNPSHAGPAQQPVFSRPELKTSNVCSFTNTKIWIIFFESFPKKAKFQSIKIPLFPKVKLFKKFSRK